MEPLFWILCNGFCACFICSFISVIVTGLMDQYRIHVCTRKYLEKEIITKKQKKHLPEILLQKSQEELKCGNHGDAYCYIDDCLKLCKWNDNTDLRQRATMELARYYAAAGKDKKALEVLAPLYSPDAYLLQAQLLLRQDPRENYQEIGRCCQEAMKCEELKDQALALLMARETAVNPFRGNQNASVKLTDEEQKIQAIVDAMKQSPEWAADQEHFRRSAERFLQKKG